MKDLSKKQIVAIILLTLLCLIILAAGIFYIYYDEQISELWEIAADAAEKWNKPKWSDFCYRRAIERNPSNVDAYLAIAESSFENLNYTKAEKYLDEAIKNNPDYTPFYLLLCRVYFAQDKLFDSLTLLEGIEDTVVRNEIAALRPAAPTASYESGTYNRHIIVSVSGSGIGVCIGLNGEFPSTATLTETATYTPNVGDSVLLAVSVDENGLVSAASRYEYHLEGVSEVASFKDRTIESLARKQLGFDDGRVITTDDLKAVTSLSLPDENGTLPEGITTLDDLSMFESLMSLNVNGAAGFDWTFLSNLTALTELSASGCALTTADLTNLSNLSKLITLDLSNNQIASVEALSGCTSLKILNLSGNSIQTVEPLAQITGMRELNLSANAITSIDALSGMKKLHTLDISYLLLSDISALRGLTALVNLKFDYCAVEDITPISECESLVNLSCESNHIISLAPLAGCGKLQTAILARNRISDISPVAKLGALRALDLTSNDIVALPEDMSGMVSLSELLLANNSISNLKSAGGLPSLEMLNIEYNAVTSLEPLTKCPKLRTVRAFGNSDTLLISTLEEQGVTVYR